MAECPDCGEKFTSKALRFHEMTAHPVECQECGQSYPSIQLLRLHREVAHPEVDYGEDALPEFVPPPTWRFSGDSSSPIEDRSLRTWRNDGSIKSLTIFAAILLIIYLLFQLFPGSGRGEKDFLDQQADEFRFDRRVD